MGCDTICDLPDSLLTQILLNLPTKDSVKTSVLLTRWRNLWLSVPGLDIYTSHIPNEEVYTSFMNRFMEFNQGSCLHIMRHRDAIKHQTQHSYTIDRVMELISTVVDRGIQHLDVTLHPLKRYAFMRHNIYKSKALVSLKLAYIELKNPEFVVSLPCLKIMRLIKVFYGKDGPLTVEKLILGCSVLEDLTLINPFDILNREVVMKFLRVRSPTLKRYCLRCVSSMSDFKVEIDAPRLEYLSLSENQSDMIVGHYCYFKLGLIPKFHNLYHLKAPFNSSSLQLLPAFLERCPNLKSLSLLGFSDSKKPRLIDFTNVPRCLISTLEYVEIKKWMMKDVTGIIKLMNYSLENSAVLKKMTLSIKQYPSITKQEAEIYKKLLTSTKLSPTCQVIILSDMQLMIT